MVTSMLSSAVAGFIAHIALYDLFTNTFTERTSRLMSFAVGMLLDIPLSWFTIRQHDRNTSDRRKAPSISFPRYVYIRAIAALTLGAGVVFGYMLDKKIE